MAADTTFVLFAAGRGERLNQLTEDLPKACLPMLDIPLGAWGLRALTSVGQGRVVINTAHRADQVVVGLKPYAGDARFMNEAPQPYGTGGTLAALREDLDVRVVTWNADELTDLNPAELLAAHERLGAPATLAVVPVSAGADLELAGDAAVGFIDRWARPASLGAQFIGAAVFDRVVLDLLPVSRPMGLAEGLIGPLVARREVAVHRHRGYALDVGTPERYLQASTDLLQGKGPPPPATYPGAIDGAGATYLGPAARAAPGTLGPGAILLAGANVEAGARVAHAIVWTDENLLAGVVAEKTVWAKGGQIFPA